MNNKYNKSTYTKIKTLILNLLKLNKFWNKLNHLINKIKFNNELTKILLLLLYIHLLKGLLSKN